MQQVVIPSRISPPAWVGLAVALCITLALPIALNLYVGNGLLSLGTALILGAVWLIALRRRLIRFEYQLTDDTLFLEQSLAGRSQAVLRLPLEQVISFERAGPYALRAATPRRVDYFCLKATPKHPLWLLVYTQNGRTLAVLLQPNDAFAHAVLDAMAGKAFAPEDEGGVLCPQEGC